MDIGKCYDLNGTWYNYTCYTLNNTTPDIYDDIRALVNSSNSSRGGIIVSKSPSDEYFQYAKLYFTFVFRLAIYAYIIADFVMVLLFFFMYIYFSQLVVVNSLLKNPIAIKNLSCHLFSSRHVLEISDGFHDMGAPKWKLVLCLLLAWVLVCVCMIKGIKSSGRVSKEQKKWLLVSFTFFFQLKKVGTVEHP